MKTPIVSVLVPTYNYARFLPQTIESILAVDYPEFEVWIVDDCSADDSAEVIKRYAAQDKRIKFRINPVNLGLVENWNYCLQLAAGEYVKYVFGDDKFASPHVLTILVRMLEANPSAVMAVSARTIIDGNSKVLRVSNDLGKAGVYRGTDMITRCLRRSFNLIGEPSVVLFRKQDALRGFNPRYRQLPDLEMWFHLLEHGDLVFTPEPLCCFRTHPRQQTELNRVHRVGEKEALILLSQYCLKPCVSPMTRRLVLFEQLYLLRKRNDTNAEEAPLRQDLLTKLGQVWFTAFWLRHKMVAPFLNLQRSLRKRLPGKSCA